MNNLHIKTPEKTISIHLLDGDISIAVDPDRIIKASGLEWSDTLLGGEAVDYDDAEKAIAALGNGWRMPTRPELESILDLSRHDPAIDTDRFPDTKSRAYWTCTPCAWNETADRWVVLFGYGVVYDIRRGGYACVRAVRSSQ